MSSRPYFLLLIAGSFANQAASAQGPRTGILIAPFDDAGSTRRGSAGDLVQFRDSPGGGMRFDIELKGKTTRTCGASG